MVARQTDKGFTLVELIIALFVLTLFITLFFQLFLSNEAQRVAITRRAIANDIAQTNLLKYPSQDDIPSSITCNSTDTSGANPNNELYNTGLTGSDTGGTEITGYHAESIPAPLNSATTQQHIYVIYPRGCGAQLPVEIRSAVTFDGPAGQETVVRAAYVN
ncbi:MAG: hypothetical protein JWO07_389 [Candidatus Saccharibacteria bacterium]|nr:hypothetical protein [Candidatus Saccharibacteria bacterium]